MCGIAAWVDYREDLRPQRNVLEKMSATLADRGPDARGMAVWPEAALVHRRLIVIDPEHGAQPMGREQGGDAYTLVYNGELYNTAEIRRDLIALGYTFEGHCDTEALLLAYLAWGEDCLDHFNGIYAFAVWDEKRRRLFLARDRMGVKPLFFYEYPGGLVAGSQIKTLLQNPHVAPVIDEQGLMEIFLLGPGRSGGCGVFKGVGELQPGQCAVFDEKGLRIRDYWALRAAPHEDGPEETVARTRDLLMDAITGQLVSDVPLCCFLSGGLDSSVISSLAAANYRARGLGPVTTYSVDYADNQRYFTRSVFQPNDDAAYIPGVADYIGAENRRVVLGNDELADALVPAALARDLPGMADIDSSLLLFCRHVKADFTVALSGECADEVFGGYPWYHNPQILYAEGFPWSRSLDVRMGLLKPGLLPRGETYVRQRYLDTVHGTDALPDDSRLDKRMREMFRLNLFWFMQTLLDRKDRMSMACGLEVRVPFCDHRVVEYAYNMPWHLKSPGGREKGVIRQAMAGLLPDEILWRKKSPYPKTHNPDYGRRVSERVRVLLQDSSSPMAALVRREAVEALMENPAAMKTPWYGQLMGAPQVLAYLLQLDGWMRHFDVQVAI